MYSNALYFFNNVKNFNVVENVNSPQSVLTLVPFIEMYDEFEFSIRFFF